MTHYKNLQILLFVPFILLAACQAAEPAAVAIESTMSFTTTSPSARPTNQSAPTVERLPPATPTAWLTPTAWPLPAVTPTPWFTPTATPTAAGCLFAPYGIGGGVPVYASADMESEKVGKVVMGQRLPVLQKGGEWHNEGNNSSGQFYQIQLDECTVGWVLDMRGGLEGDCSSNWTYSEAVPQQGSPSPTACRPMATPVPLALLGNGSEPVPPLPGMIYEDEAGVWLVESDGSHKLLTDQLGLKISPDGTRGLQIVDGDVWIHTLSSGERTNVTAESGRSHMYAAWWPANPDTLVLSSKGLEDEGPNHGRLTLVDVDGNNYFVIQADGPSAGAAPAPRADGRTIAYDMALKGMTYNLFGGAVPFDPGVYDLPEDVQIERMGSPAWSPGNDRLAWIMAVTGGGYGRDGSWDIVLGIFDFEIATVKLIHPYQPVGRGGWLPPATWSPDGKWLTFSVESWDENERGLWVTSADGRQEQRLSQASNSMVIWSPSGDESWANGQTLLLTIPGWEKEDEIWLVQTGSWQQVPLALKDKTVIDWRQHAAEAFGIYLLTEDKPATQLEESDLRPIELQEQPVISINDIISYDRNSHEMRLSGEAYQRVRELFPLPVRVDGIPFVVRVGAEPIYAGAFWTPLSSLSYDGVIIRQPFDDQGELIRLTLGNPGSIAFTGADPRGDPRIIEVLDRAGKLK